jgi:NAD(P)-dependent dehydrogenase (short-subunit alcohol dehydrogenase family)
MTVVLVTGGTRGIGRAIAAAFVADGAEVLVCARTTPTEPLPGAAFVVADVREPDQAAGVVDEAVHRFGRLDVAVNNAGGAPLVPAASASPGLATSVVRLNLLAPFFVAQAANAVMQRQEAGGLILNIGSVAVERPAPGAALYAAAKAGLATLTRALALEWAPRVRVNCVSAGPVRSQYYGRAHVLERIAETVPLGRMAEPADIANACLLLASPLAGYVTGATLTVDGGGQRPAFVDAISPHADPPGDEAQPDPRTADGCSRPA